MTFASLQLHLARGLAVALAGLALFAGGATVARYWTAPVSGVAQDFVKIAPLLPHLPRNGPEVELVPGLGIAVLGYCTAAEAFTDFERAVVDPELRQRIDESSLRYLLTQQAVAPRLLVLPSHPAYQAVKLVVAHFAAPEDVPDAAANGMQTVVDTGTGLVLWRRR